MTATAPPPRPSTSRLNAPPLSEARSKPRPRSIAISWWLWVAATGLALVTAAMAATRADALHEEFTREAHANDASASAQTLDRVADLSVLIVIGGGLLLAVLGVLFAAVMRGGGRAWARGVLVVVTVLAVGYAALVMSTGTLVLAYAAAAVVAAICMYLPGSRAWFM